MEEEAQIDLISTVKERFWFLLLKVVNFVEFIYFKDGPGRFFTQNIDLNFIAIVNSTGVQHTKHCFRTAQLRANKGVCKYNSSYAKKVFRC
jgi:hypothetical protein